MSWREAIASALAHLAAHKLRSALAMLGVVFGVGAVISMLSIGAGAERQALETIERLGRRNLVLRAKELKTEELREVRKRSIGLARRDVEAIRAGLPGVEMVAARIEVSAWQVLSASGRSKAEVHGVAAEWPSLVTFRLAEGRFFDADEERRHAQVAVLGPAARRELFGYSPALGGRVKVNDVWFEVIGVLAEAGTGAETFQGVALGSTARTLWIPVSTAERKLERDPEASPFDEIVVRLAVEADPVAAARALSTLTDRLHAGAADYELVVPEALLAESRRTQRLFNVVMGSIAGISLLVGGIGIMNILLASVLERTREIGVRRAVGARREDIRRQFLVEAFAITALGGAAGILLGLALSAGVALWAGWQTKVTLVSVVVASGVATAVGVASGYYPAARAADLDPIDALRWE